MQLPDPGSPGAMDADSHIAATWGTLYLNKYNFRLGTTADRVTWHGDVVIAGDSSLAGVSFVANNQGQLDADPDPANVDFLDIGGRSSVRFRNIEIVGNVDGGGTSLMSKAQKPGVYFENLKVSSIGAPTSTDDTNPENDTAWDTNDGRRGIKSTLTIAVDLSSFSTITVADDNTMSLIPSAGTIRIGAQGVVPSVVDYGSVVQNGDTTWTFSSCSVVSQGFAYPTYSVGTRVRSGVDRKSGRWIADRVVFAGTSSQLYLYYPGDDEGASGAISLGASEPEVEGDTFFEDFFFQYISNDGFRIGSNAQAVKVAHGSLLAHPDTFVVTGLHCDGAQVTYGDNSMFSEPRDDPAFEWIYFASDKGNTGIFLNDSAGPVLNYGIRHCLFSCENKALQVAAGPTGSYFGYSYLDKFNTGDKGDSIQIASGSDLRVEQIMDRTSSAETLNTRSSAGVDDGDPVVPGEPPPTESITIYRLPYKT